MTAVAGCRELAAMRILCAVAAGTVTPEFLRCGRCGVTAVAVESRMHTLERKAGQLRVIVGNRPPRLIGVAALAVLTEAACVRIIGTMTTTATGRQLSLVIAAAMAVSAVERSVVAEQRKPRLTRMIEACGMPLACRMTLSAFRAASTLMCVVGRVAAHAALRCGRIVPADMTGIAAQLLMGAREREARLAVVEAATEP